MEIGRLDGMKFMDSIIDKETGEMVEPSMEVIRNTGIIPYLSAIFAALAKRNEVTIRWEEIEDEDGEPKNGFLLAEAEEDDELLEVIDACSNEFETAVAEMFAKKEAEDE